MSSRPAWATREDLNQKKKNNKEIKKQNKIKQNLQTKCSASSLFANYSRWRSAFHFVVGYIQWP